MIIFIYCLMVLVLNCFYYYINKVHSYILAVFNVICLYSLYIKTDNIIYINFVYIICSLVLISILTSGKEK